MALQGSLAIIPVIASKADRRFSEDITHSGLPVPSISVFPGEYRIIVPVMSLSLLRPGKARRVPSRPMPNRRTESAFGLAGLPHTYARSMPHRQRWQRSHPAGSRRQRRSEGLAPSLFRMDHTAIRYYHSETGHANPADNEGVCRVLGLHPPGCERPHHETGRRAYGPGAGGDLRYRPSAVHRTLGGRTEGAHGPPPQTPWTMALISVMRDAMLRCSETVAVHLGRRGVRQRRVG